MTRRIAYALVGLAVLLFAGYAGMAFYESRSGRLPEGIAYGNGRIEADQVDIAARYAGRVEAVHVQEGDLVHEGQELARMDVAELKAALDGAEARAALARETLAEARALEVQRRSELRLAEQELARARKLAADGHVAQSALDARITARDVAAAALGAAQAHVETARRSILSAEAETRRILAQIEDSVLTSPAEGRVLYRLAEPGEIVPAGAPVLTLVDLTRIYMEIFLPARQAGLLPLGAEARIVLDILPDYAIPAVVSFVSPEAQFTPKQVETLDEREKLVFRVRVRIPPELIDKHVRHVKTGLRGVAYVRLRPSVEWPERLQRFPPPDLFE